MKLYMVVMLCAFLCVGSAVGNMVENAGFETGDLTSWSTFGTGWRIGTGADARTGDYGMVSDILTTDDDEFRGVYQHIPVLPNNLYSGGVYIRAVNLDTSTAWFEIQFLDTEGDMISQHQSSHVSSDQGFTFMGLVDVLAPADAVTASIRGIVNIPASPSQQEFIIFDDFTFTDVSPDLVLLENWGFETGDYAGWTLFGEGWRIGTGGDAFSGTYGVVNDVTTSAADEWRGVFQNIPVREGLTYAAGTYIRTVNVESSESWLELQWLNDSGGIISQLSSPAITNDQPFFLSSLHDIVAPAGAVTASVRGIVRMLSTPTEETAYHIYDEFYFLRPVFLTLSLHASTNLVAAHEYITYTIVVSNRSASMSGSYFVTQDFGTNLAFVSATAGGVNEGTLVNWSMFGLPGGASTALHVVATQPHYTGATQLVVHAVSASLHSGIGNLNPESTAVNMETTTVGIPMFTWLTLSVLGLVIGYAFYRQHRLSGRASG